MAKPRVPPRISSQLIGAPEGFTVLELLVVMGILVTLAAIVWPQLLYARVSANEAAAVATVRTVIEAQAIFAASCGRGGYAPSLQDLGSRTSGAPGFIPPDLSEGTKHGYVFTLSPGADADVISESSPECGTASFATVDAYHVTAVPVNGGVRQRSFAADQRGTIYQSATGEPIQNPIPPEIEPVD